VRGEPGRVTNPAVSTVVAGSAEEIESRRLRRRIRETLESSDAGADVLRVQTQEPAAAASQMISSHQRNGRST
jgi:hypothetical protein